MWLLSLDTQGTMRIYDNNTANAKSAYPHPPPLYELQHAVCGRAACMHEHQSLGTPAGIHLTCTTPYGP